MQGRNYIFAVYKPSGMTSHDVVDRVRRVIGVKKVGHAGTLDPLARGVLVVGVGRQATKLLSQISNKEKEYLAQITLGYYSETDDTEGLKHKVTEFHIPTKNEVSKALCGFVGLILQRPPDYSAVKVGGKPAYKIARSGRQVKLAERQVRIKAIQILQYHWPTLKIKVTTGAGVYIRALARDVGEQLGTGGYVEELERTRVGEYRKEESVQMSELEAFCSSFRYERTS